MAHEPVAARRILARGTLLALMLPCLCSGAAQAQTARQSTTPRTAVVPVAAASAPGGYNAVTTSLQKAGVKRCAAAIQRVTEFLANKSRTGTAVFPLGSNPDDSLITLSSEIMAGNVVFYAGATFAPNGNGCSAVYEAVTHWQNTCDDVVAAQYANLKPVGVLQQQIRVLSNQPNTQVMVVAAGTGCVVIKKELVQ